MAQVRTRKRGKTYSYIFEAGQVNGKRKVIEKGGFATKDKAYEAGVAAYTDWKHGNIGLTSDKITLNDFTDGIFTVTNFIRKALIVKKLHNMFP